VELEKATDDKIRQRDHILKPDQMVQHIEKLFEDQRGGFFIEAGAHNGTRQSTTMQLLPKGFAGVLVEPDREMANLCANKRPESKVYNCALVSHEYASKYDVIGFTPNEFSKLMSKVYFQHNRKDAPIPDKMEMVMARTLTFILDDAFSTKFKQGTQIDFLSLDVEGAELEVLNGLDFKKYRPRYVLIETWEQTYKEVVSKMESEGYEWIDTYTHNDYLFVVKELK